MQLLPLARARWADPARLAAQSTAAAALAYIVITGFGLPHASWAVISALLVGQRSVDGTLAAVRGRIAATLIGAATGLAFVALLDGEGSTLPRLLLAAAVVNAIAGFHPQLRYGAVVAAIICLQPGADPLEGAGERTVAIIVGAAAGGACAFAVWPQSAARRTQRAVQRALVDCAELLDASLRRVLGDAADIDPLHRRFLRDIGNAREQASTARRMARRHEHLEALVHAVERLWHALIMLDRLTRPEHHWSPDADSPLRAQVHGVRKHACQTVRALAASLGGEVLPKDQALAVAVQQARKLALDPRASEPKTGCEHGGQAAALAFALGEVEGNLEEIRTARSKS